MDRADSGNGTTGGIADQPERAYTTREVLYPGVEIISTYEPDPAAMLAVLRLAMDSYNERQAQAASAQADEAAGGE